MGPCDIALNPLGGLHLPPGGIKLRIFSGLGIKRIEFSHSVAEKILLRLQSRKRILRILQRTVGLARRPPKPGDLVALALKLGKSIKQSAVALRIQQAAVIMLAVQLYKML